MTKFTPEEKDELSKKLSVFIDSYLKDKFQLYEINKLNDDIFIQYQCLGKEAEFLVILFKDEEDDTLCSITIDNEKVLQYIEKEFKLDIYNKTKKSLDDLDFLHCFLFGSSVIYTYTPDEMISNYFYDGDNLIFEGIIQKDKGNGFEASVLFDLFIDLDYMNITTIERWILRDFKPKNGRNLEKHKKDIIEHYAAKKLGKDIENVRMHDHKILAILNHI